MRGKTRALSLLLAAAMVVSLLPAAALAEEAPTAPVTDSSMEESAGAPGAPVQASLISAFAALDQDTYEIENGGDALAVLPDTLLATVDGAADTPVSVTWTEPEGYGATAAGNYSFTASAEGYALAESLSWPQVTVTVKAAAEQDPAPTTEPDPDPIPASEPEPVTEEGGVATMAGSGGGTASDVYVSSSGNDSNSGAQESPYATITKAYTEVADGGTIHVIGNMTLATAVTMSTADKAVTIQGVKDGGSVPVVTVADTTSASFSVVQSASVTFRDITLEGQGKDTRVRESTFIMIGTSSSSGSVTLDSGATIQNVGMKAAGISFGVITIGKYSTLTMKDGSTIQNLTAYSGCIRAHTTGAKFVMDGGLIQNCDSLYSTEKEGNAIYLSNGGKMEMHGGEITGCGKHSNVSNGTVFLHSGNYPTAFSMDGGSIHDNTAIYGGGVYMDGGTVTLSGTPVIRNNTGTGLNGDSNIYLKSGQTVTIGTEHLQPGADVGIYAAGTLNETTDVKIATGANASDAAYFHSDNADTAGILYCDGNSDTPVTGHHTPHAAGLYLSTANKTVVKQSITIDATGKASLTVSPVKQDSYYIIQDKNGKLYDADGTEAQGSAASTWTKATAEHAANGLTFTGLDPANGPYQVYSTNSGTLTDLGHAILTGGKVGFYYVAGAAAAAVQDTVKHTGWDQGADSGSGGDSIANDGIRAQPFASVGTAYGKAETDGVSAAGIIVLSEVTATATSVLGTAIDVTLAGEGQGRTIKLADGATFGHMLKVTKGSLTITDLTLDGNRLKVPDNAGALIFGVDATVTLGRNAVLQNNKNADSSANILNGGGALHLQKSTLNIQDGSLIRNNHGRKGSIYVVLHSVVNMTGGAITGNSAKSDVGALCAMSTSGETDTNQLNLSGGSITGNRGGISCTSVTGTLTVSGSMVISGNTYNGVGRDIASSTLYVGKGGWSAADPLYITTSNAQTVVADCTAHPASLDGLLGKIVCNNGDTTIKKDDSADMIVIDGTGKVAVDLKTGSLTNVTASGGEVTYKLGSAAVKGTGGKTFEIGVDKGYFTVDTTTMPAGASFATSLTTGGTLATSGTPMVGAHYTYLSFITNNASSAALQSYLRSHVTFHRGTDMTQKVTVIAENADLGALKAFRGHYYEFVANTGINWSQAYKAAKEKNFNGLTGYLITVTDKTEHDYVYQLFSKNGWMGATRAVPTGGYDGRAFPYSSTGLNYDWHWACGPEQGQTIGTQRPVGAGMASVSGYNNWTSGEPNGRGVPNTRYEGFGQYGYRSGGRWNDLPDAATGSIQGYYVEYGGYPGETLTTPRAQDTRTVTPPAQGAPQEGIQIETALDPTDSTKSTITVTGGDTSKDYVYVDPSTGGVVNEPAAGKQYDVYEVDKGVTTKPTTADGWAELVDAGLASKVETLITPVKPTENLKNTIVRAGDTLTVLGATDTTRDYALVDSKGNVTAWQTGKSGGLTFEGLDPDETYTVVESGKAAGDATHGYTTEGAPKVLPAPSADSLQDGGGSVVVRPADKDLVYTVTPQPSGATITGVYDEATGSVKFPNLTPGTEYQVSVSNKGGGDRTTGPKFHAPCAPAAATRGANGDSISVTSPEVGKTYTLVDNNGSVVGTATAGGSPVSWSSPDPKLTYHVQVVETAKAATQIPARTPVYPFVDAAYTATIAPDTGKGVLEVGPVAAGTYTIGGQTYTAKEGEVLRVETLTPGSKVVIHREGATDVTVTIPAISPDAIQGGPADGEKSSIVVDPSVSGVEYAVIDKTTGKVVGASQTGTGGALTFPGLTPGSNYQVVVVDSEKTNGTDTTEDEKKSAVDFKAPPAPVSGGSITREASTPDATKDKITITGSDANLEYAVIDKTTGQVVAPAPGLSSSDGDGDGWVTGTGSGGLVFDGLDKDKVYEVVSRTPASGSTPAGLPSGGVATLPGTGSTVNKNDVGTEADKNGKQHALIGGTSADQKYAVIDKTTGQVVKPGGSSASGDGWFTGNGGKLDLGALPPGDYQIVTMPKAEGDTEAPGKDDSSDSAHYPTTVNPSADPSAPNLSVPTVSPNQITGGKVENGKTSITVKPADKDLVYGVVDKDGNKISDDLDQWVTVQPNGSVVIGNLPAGAEVQVVTKPRNDPNPAKPSGVTGGADAGTHVTTPSVPADSSTVERIPGDPTDSIKVGGASGDNIYAVVDKDGNLVAPITAKVGAPASTVSGDQDGWIVGGDPLVFEGLDPDETYQVVVSKKPDGYTNTAPDNDLKGIIPGYTTGPAVAPSVSLDNIGGGDYDDNGTPTNPADDTTSIVIGTPKPGVDYGVLPGGGAFPGDVIWDTDGDGIIDGLKPGTDYTVVTKPHGDGNESDSVKGPTVTTPGKPLEDDQISREPDSTSDAIGKTKDQITIPAESGKQYAIVDSDGNYLDMTNKDGSAASNGEKWSTGSDTGSLVIQGLDPAKTYQVLVKDAGKPSQVPSVSTSKPNADNAVPKDSVHATVKPDGFGSITVDNSVAGKDYVLVDKDGNAVVVKPGNGGKLDFDQSVLPGQDYTVVMKPSGTVQVGNEHVNTDRGAGVTVPVTGSDGGLTTGIDSADTDKRAITVKPTNPALDYVLVDSSGNEVKRESGKADHSAILFSGLDAGTGYYVTTVKKRAGTVSGADISKLPGVNTPSGSVTLPSADNAAKDKNSITLDGLNADQQYNLMDKDGNLVKDQWVKPAADGSLSFGGLTPGADYTVVTREPDVDHDFTDGKQPSGILTGPTITTDANGGSTGGTGGTGGGGGGGSSSTGSTTGTGKVDGGAVSTDPKDPKPGDKVTVTVKPDEGKAVGKITVTDKRGNELEVTLNPDGTFTYVQPEKKNAPVKIEVTFKDVTGDPHTNGVAELLVVDEHIAYLKGDGKGNFNPTAAITRAEAAQMFYNLLNDKNVSGDASFSDVSDDAWYAKAVLALANLEIVNGVGADAFAPDRPISRAEFVAIAARFAEATTGSASFTDVSADHWAYELIGRASYYGWINGYTDGTFQPQADLQRAEAAKVVNTMLGRSADKGYIDAHKAELTIFPDVAESNWAFYEIVEAANAHDFTLDKDGVESWGK